MQSTYLRNKAVLEWVLSGKNYHECAAEYKTSANSIMSHIRYVLEALKEHTEMSIEVHSGYDYVIENKETILKYLAYPIPIVNITPQAKQYLRKTFGKQYANVPEKVAQDWESIEERFKSYPEKRDLVSIQCWLASVGYLQGDYVNEEMRKFAYEALIEKLKTTNKNEKELGFKIVEIKRSHYTKPDLFITAELKSGIHVVKRRFSVELLDY